MRNFILKKYILISLLTLSLTSQASSTEKPTSLLTGAQLYEKVRSRVAVSYALSLSGVAASGYLIHKGINEQKKWKIAVGVLGVCGGFYFGLRSAFEQGYLSGLTKVYDIFYTQPWVRVNDKL